MKGSTDHADVAGMSDDAVMKKTGRDWAQWFQLLDARGCAAMTHKQIVAVVHEVRDVGSGWWEQMITVAFERARGLREKHQTSQGFTAQISRTLAASAQVVHDAWTKTAVRKRWLGGGELRISSATSPKYVRGEWGAGGRIEVVLTPKSPRKVQCAVQHNQLANARDVARSKASWADALAALKAIVEAPSPAPRAKRAGRRAPARKRGPA